MKNIKNIFIIFCILFGVVSLPAEEVDAFKPCEDHIVQQIYQMMLDVHDFCTLYEIPYFVDGGTLLGAVRHKGLIPWDDDLDICIFEEDEKRFLSLFSVLQNVGYSLATMHYGHKIYFTNGTPIEGFSWNAPGCDIFIMERKEDKIRYKLNFPKENKIDFSRPLDNILPLRNYSFGPLVVKGPNNPYPHFEKWYGKHYLTVAARSYDHTREKRIKRVRKPLKKNDLKPALPKKPLQPNIPS